MSAAPAALIAARFPDLAAGPFEVIGDGWDNVAVDVGGRVIVRIPRDAEGEAQLGREAAMLAIVRPAVTLRVPALAISAGPPLISRHDKIPGEQLTTERYAPLAEADRDAVAEQIAWFLAELHALPVAAMRAAGAIDVDEPDPVDEIAASAWPRLDDDLKPAARALLDRLAALPADPLPPVFGHFDVHGWNMAFDPIRRRLAGIYDFGDAGIGTVHEEFVALNFVSPDLTARVADRYERLTGRALDRARIATLTGALRLSELASEGDDPVHGPIVRRQVREWFGGG